jgi:hypothetical protein
MQRPLQKRIQEAGHVRFDGERGHLRRRAATSNATGSRFELDVENEPLAYWLAS